jgi:hypothetical protein
MKKWTLAKKAGHWEADSGGQTVEGTRSRRKADALKRTAEAAEAAPQPVSLMVKSEDGQIQEERTYPREADPSRSQG